MPPVAFSYIRFSHPSQADGDSLRRQTEAATVWSRRNHATLDMTTTLLDLGKSAFVKARRDPFEEDPMAAFIDQDDLVNPDRRALAGFQALIKRRRVPRGAFLIIENLDRLSRDDVVPATHLLSRVERWRGGLGDGMSVYPGFPCVAQHRTPCPVSTSRSSNRTCGFPASGSRTRHPAYAHEKLRRFAPSRTSPSTSYRC